MTQDELLQLLDGEEILKTLDIKTLVLDTMRDMPQEEFLDIFWEKLPALQSQYVKDYLYMKRT